jgi:hypothetical protein
MICAILASICLKYLSEKYGINFKEMLKKPPDEDVEYLRKTFYDDIPKKTKSYFPMENYGLTEAGYGYVGELLKFSEGDKGHDGRK